MAEDVVNKLKEEWEQFQVKREETREFYSNLCQKLVEAYAKDNKFCPICGQPMVKSGYYSARDHWSYSLVCNHCHFYHGMEFEKLESLLMWIIYYGETFEDESC